MAMAKSASKTSPTPFLIRFAVAAFRFYRTQFTAPCDSNRNVHHYYDTHTSWVAWFKAVALQASLGRCSNDWRGPMLRSGELVFAIAIVNVPTPWLRLFVRLQLRFAR